MNTELSPEDRVCIEAYMSRCFSDKVRSAAKRMNVSLSSFVRIALGDYLDQHKARFQDPVPVRIQSYQAPVVASEAGSSEIDRLKKEIDELLDNAPQ